MRIENPELLAEMRSKPTCEHCRYYPANHAAHLYHNGMGGKKPLDVRFNVCGLCWRCHSLHHNGKEPTLAMLLEIVSKRERLEVGTIVDRVRLLQRLDKSETVPSWV